MRHCCAKIAVVLHLAAVVGGRFHVAMLAHVTQLARERVGEVLEGLVGREILVQTGAEEMGFAHGLVPEIARNPHDLFKQCAGEDSMPSVLRNEDLS